MLLLFVVLSRYYYIEIYYLQDIENKTISLSFGCGDVIVEGGQSNMLQQGSGTLISTPHGAIWHYFEDGAGGETDGPIEHPQTRGEGDAALGNALIAASGKPVLIINYAISGAAIDAILELDPLPGVARTLDLTGVQDASVFNWIQGETNAVYGTPYSTYYASLESMKDLYENSFHTNIPIVIGEIGRTTGDGTDAGYDDIREATRAFINAESTVFLGGISIVQSR